MAIANISKRQLCARSPRQISLYALCCFLGLACIALDANCQPLITKLGHAEPIHTVAKLWQELGSTCGIVLFITAGLICLPRDRGATLIYFAATASAAGLSVQILKRIIGRVRPYASHDTTSFLGPLALFDGRIKGPIDSMPSGHTTVAFAMAVALAHQWPRVKWLWYILAAGVAVSRSLMDAHFPSDVILGACLGTGIGLLIVWAFEFRSLSNDQPHDKHSPPH